MDTKQVTNMEQNCSQSEIIGWLRFPLIIFVIFIHNFGMPKQVNINEIDFFSFTGMDLYNIIRVTIRKIVSTCNFIFFLFSGYLFFINITNFNRNVYAKKIKTRAKTLLIPYFLWNVISIFYIAIKKIIETNCNWKYLLNFFNELTSKGFWSVFWYYRTWGNEINILSWAVINTSPFLVPMWFLQTLLALSILTPLVYLFCKYCKFYGLLLLWILYYTGIWVSFPGLSIGAAFFFTLGAYFGIHKKNMFSVIKKRQILYYIISILTLFPATYLDYDGTIAYNFVTPIFTLTAVFSIINLANYLLQKKIVAVNKTFSQATFFIYGVHTIFVLYPICNLFDVIFNTTSWFYLLLRYLLIPIITAFACILLYCILGKIAPKLLNILSGSRMSMR